MSGFSLLDQRQWIQSERQRMEFLGTLHLFYVRGGIWSLMEWFFCLLSSFWRQLKSQCGGERVGYLGTLHLFHVRGGIFVSRGGGCATPDEYVTVFFFVFSLVCPARCGDRWSIHVLLHHQSPVVNAL